MPVFHSMKECAEHLGVEYKMLQAAVRSKRVTWSRDGHGRLVLDSQRVERQLEANTDSAKGRPGRQAEARPETDGAWMRARTQREAAKAREAELKLAALEQRLAPVEVLYKVLDDVMLNVRRGWEQWPARVSAGMAAELGVDQVRLETLLEAYVRDNLAELAKGETNPAPSKRNGRAS